MLKISYIFAGAGWQLSSVQNTSWGRKYLFTLFKAGKIIELTLQEFHLGSFVLELFRHDYNNLGRFTQLCQTFDLFVCLLIGFFFISMNCNPLRTGIYYHFIKGAGGWVSRNPPNVWGRAVCRAGLYNHHVTDWNSWRIFYPFFVDFCRTIFACIYSYFTCVVDDIILFL